MERAKRIELSSQPWQGRVLPLNRARVNLFTFNTNSITNFFNLYNYFFLAVFLAVPAEDFAPWGAAIFCCVSSCGCTPNSVDAMLFK